jgi:hypothetical protein
MVGGSPTRNQPNACGESVTTGTTATLTGGKTACIDTRVEIRLAVRTILIGVNDTTRNAGAEPLDSV